MFFWATGDFEGFLQISLSIVFLPNRRCNSFTWA
jgi:hypothetical protein